MKYYCADGQGAINLRPKTDAGALGVMADEEVRLYEVRLHLSAASAAEDFITKLDSGLGARYDAVLDTKAMNALADYVYKPTLCPEYIRAGDELVITKTNAALLSWSVVIVYE